MNDPQNRPAFGKIGRTPAAEFAARPIVSSAATPSGRQRSRLPLFAQFPPAALFKAIGRAVARRAIARQPASGTVIAIGRPGRATGGP
jgi:hypothetical protein